MIKGIGVSSRHGELWLKRLNRIEEGSVQMVRRSITDKLAHSMLADYGVSIIWKLHDDAATLYRVGNRTAAETFLEIADAAENQWLHDEPRRLTVW